MFKKSLVLMMLATSMNAMSQDIAKYEYWFDHQASNRILGNIYGNSVDLQVDVNDLQEGVHTFNFRAADESGNWSSPVATFFLRTATHQTDNRIESYEYWIDGDAANKVTPPVNSQTISFNVDVAALKAGVHSLTLRAKDAWGNWSSPTAHYFIKPSNAISDNKVAGYQYWFNENTGNGSYVALQQPSTPALIDVQLPVSGIVTEVTPQNIAVVTGPGGEAKIGVKNAFHIRFKDVNDNWSAAQTDTFAVATVEENLNLTTFLTNPSADQNWSGWATTGSHSIQTSGHYSGSQNKFFRLSGSSTMIQRVSGLPAGNYTVLLMGRSSSSANASIQANGYSIDIEGTEWAQHMLTFTTDGSPFDLLISCQESNQWVDIDDIQLMLASERYNVTLAVTDELGNDITSEVTIKWQDAAGQQLGTGTTISGLTKDTQLFYSIELGEALGRKLREVQHQRVTINGDVVRCQLKPIEEVLIQGNVTGELGLPIPHADVVIRQWLNSKYVQEYTLRTDESGTFQQQAADDSTEVTISYDGYMDYKLNMRRIADGNLGNIALAPVTGKVIMPELSYQRAVKQGETADALTWYSDINNIEYKVYNDTKDKELDIAVQQGIIVIPAGVDIGDRLTLSAHSLNAKFADVYEGVTIGNNDTLNVALLLKELGGMEVTYRAKGDEESLALVYDSDGTLVLRTTFSGKRVTFSDMAADTYQLLTMGYNSTVGGVSRLEDLSLMELEDGVDYVLSRVNVQDGLITSLTVDSVPEMEPSKFSYTSVNTSYLANKSQFVAGSFVTMTARVDFKTQYANRVNDVIVVVDIPEGCEFVDNSVVIGTKLMPYTLNGGRLSVPIGQEDIDSRLRFCIAPTRSGSFTTAAYATFTFNGEKMQSIGSATFEATDMAIVAPSTTRRTSIPVGGIASPQAEVEVYDDGTLIGTTHAKADGHWNIDCELNRPYNLSTHGIYAKIRNTSNILVTTATIDCFYDINSVEAKSVTMTFYNGWLRRNIDVTFDFETGKTSSNNYSFYTATDFTFVADLTANDTTAVDAITFYVYTSSNEVRQLKGFFDDRLGRWVAVSGFDSYNLPVNLMVDVEAKVNPIIDSRQIADAYNSVIDERESILSEINHIDSIFDEVFSELEKEKPDSARVDQLLSTLVIPSVNVDENRIEDLSAMNMDDFLLYTSDEEAVTDSIIAECESLVSELLQGISDFSLYSTYDFAYNGLIQGTTTITTCDGISEETLLNEGYKKLSTIDNAPIYEILTDDYYSRVDFENNIRLTVVTRPVSQQYSSGLQRIKYSDSAWFQLIESALRNAILSLTTNTEILQKFYNLTNKNLAKKLAELAIRKKGVAEELAVISTKLETASGLNQIKLWERQAQLQRQQEYLIKSEQRLTKLSKTVALIAKTIIQLVDWTKWYFEVKIMADELNSFDIPYCAYQSVPQAVDIVEAKIDKARADFKKYYLKQFGRKAFYVIADVATGPIIGCCLAILEDAAENARDEQFKRYMEMDIAQIRKDILGLISKCKKNPDPDDGNEGDGNGGNGSGGDNSSGNGNAYPTPPFNSVTPIHDPSGFVYEAVPTNRIAGVTATIYEQAQGTKAWDAADYSQVNPQVTDDTGLYQWDVPQGMWQVRFEKSGYETTQTAWLPVPPPQLEINIPMSQAVAPQVVSARGTESGITLDFSKYMKPETIERSGRVSATVNGSNARGDVEMLNGEENPYNSKVYASRVKFVPQTAFKTSDEVVITVKKEVESYADKQMNEDFVAKVKIDSEIDGIVCDSLVAVDYQGDYVLEISAEPIAAVKGRTLSIATTSAMIATTDRQSVTFDDQGKASITVSGNLPGSASLHLQIDGTDIDKYVDVNVVLRETVVRAPKASKRSGSTIEGGYLLWLTSNTPGATIYYTLDGSCPCDAAKRLKYTEPLLLPAGQVTLKAIAVRQGMEDSDVVTYVYTVSDYDGIREQEAGTAAQVVYDDGRIVVDNAVGGVCRVYDLEGRTLATQQLGSQHASIAVPRNNVYFVTIQTGSQPPLVFKLLAR